MIVPVAGRLVGAVGGVIKPFGDVVDVIEVSGPIVLGVEAAVELWKQEQALRMLGVPNRVT